MSITCWLAAVINLRLSSGRESYSEALPWAVSDLGKDLRPSYASWQLATEAGSLEFSSKVIPVLCGSKHVVSFPVSTSLLKPHFVALWTSVNCEDGMMAHRPHGAREGLCFALSLPSQFVSFRNGCKLSVMRTALLQSSPLGGLIWHVFSSRRATISHVQRRTLTYCWPTSSYCRVMEFILCGSLF